MRERLIAAVLASTLTVGLAAGTSGAQDPGWCGIGLCNQLDKPGGEPVASSGAFEWRRTLNPFSPACTDYPDAVQYHDQLIDTRTRQVITERYGCLGDSVANTAPLPPAPEAVFSEKDLPELHVSINPEYVFADAEGLVGFETRLWYDRDLTVTLPVTLEPWTGTVTVGVTKCTWDMGNDHTVTAAGEDCQGDVDDPAATYVYDKHCQCTVTVTLTWGGTYTLAYDDGTLAFSLPPIDVGTRDFSAQRPYRVTEVQAVING